MPTDLAVDVGQSGMRVATAVSGSIKETWTGAGVTDRSDPAAVLIDALSAREIPDLSTVVIGLTSVLGDGYERFARAVLHRLNAERVVLCGDVVTAHAGALACSPGVVLAAGTGTIALGLTAAGAARQVDGWGHHFGDAGGGYWIGGRGLDAAMRAHDGRSPTPTALSGKAVSFFGDLDSIAESLYPKPDAVRVIASFAREVIDLAATDETAHRIVAAAADELALTVTAATRIFPESIPVPVSYTGNLMSAPALSGAFGESLRARLPHARLVPPASDGLGGAALLASQPDLGPYASLMKAVVTR